MSGRPCKNKIKTASLLVCLLVSVGLCARIAGQNVCVSMAEQLLTPSRQVTGSGNDMLFFSKIQDQDLSSAMYTHAHQLLDHGDTVLQKLSMR